LGGILSCQKAEMISIDDSPSKTTMEIDRLSFGSMDEFRARMYQCRTSDTKSSIDFGPRASLMSGCSDVDYQNDPILRYDLRDYKPTKADGGVSIYEAAGYEEYIPDRDLASLLNARGEIEIAGVVYKISKTGTYYFNKDLEGVFLDSYADFEESVGEKVDTLLYKLRDGIFRYATFSIDDYQVYYASDYYEEIEDESLDASMCEIAADESLFINPMETKAGTTSSLANLDYSKYPRYNSKAKTVVGKILQSLFGGNKAFDYKFTSKRKYQSKFFYYDYVFWSSIGVNAKMLKKNLLWWNKTKASELYVGWGMIVTEMPIKGTIPQLPNAAPTTVIRDEYNVYFDKNETVAYVFGMNFTQAQINSLFQQGIKYVFNTVKNKTKTDVSGVDKILLAGPTSLYLIHTPGGKSVTNKEYCEALFDKDFSIGISLDNLLNLPTKWLEWAKAIAKGTYALPNIKLKRGEVRSAVRYDGKIGAMTIYKE